MGSATAAWWCRAKVEEEEEARRKREKGRKRRERGQREQRPRWREGREGEEGEGLTAINFAKIGAYPVVGRQSNPGSARATPFA